MNKCKICNKEILNDSQYINGSYYHNECIEQLQQNKLNFINYLEKRFNIFNNLEERNQVQIGRRDELRYILERVKNNNYD